MACLPEATRAPSDNPLACAAGLAVLHIIDEDGLIENARHLGEYLAERLVELDAKLETTAGTRGIGLLQGIVLADHVDPGATLAAIHSAGLLLTLAGGNVIRISPSLNVGRGELDEGLSILAKVLSDAPRKR